MLFDSKSLTFSIDAIRHDWQVNCTTASGKSAFTAIIAPNDLMAFGAWKALEQNGYKIPDDISIIGYDDIPFSSFISLTTIAQPGY